MNPTQVSNSENFSSGSGPQLILPCDTQLIQAVNTESKDNPGKLSKKKQGPFVAGVRDSANDDVSVKRNMSNIPDNPHRIIAARIAAEKEMVNVLKKMPPDQRTTIRTGKDEEVLQMLTDHGIPPQSEGMDNVKAMRNVEARRQFFEERAQRIDEQNKGEQKGSGWDGTERMSEQDWKGMSNEIGTHAEVHALNDCLQAREGTDRPVTDPSQLGEFQIDVAKNGTDSAGPRCHHCENITSGTEPTTRLGTADNQRDTPKQTGTATVGAS